MSSRKRRRLTKAELRAMGATPGLMAHRIGPDGRARLEQLAPEGSGQPSLFLRPESNNCSKPAEKGD
jgi:hypothetical protein